MTGPVRTVSHLRPPALTLPVSPVKHEKISIPSHPPYPHLYNTQWCPFSPPQSHCSPAPFTKSASDPSSSVFSPHGLVSLMPYWTYALSQSSHALERISKEIHSELQAKPHHNQTVQQQLGFFAESLVSLATVCNNMAYQAQRVTRAAQLQSPLSSSLIKRSQNTLEELVPSLEHAPHSALLDPPKKNVNDN